MDILLQMLQSASLSTISCLSHGFFGRRGGVSDGLYDSLNCGYGSGDAIDKVTENRRRVSEQLGTSAPVLTCFQIHSANVMTVDTPWEWKNSPEADALVTDQSGIPLGILTADCLPVLFADRKKKVIGAAHAGWKGAMSGVLEATLQAMNRLGACDIVAAVGPAIAQSSYEVGPEFIERFIQESSENHEFFISSGRRDHFFFDLPAYAKARLMRAGICDIDILGHDTCAYLDDFFSYRRATLRGEKVYGRQIATIMIKPVDR